MNEVNTMMTPDEYADWLCTQYPGPIFVRVEQKKRTVTKWKIKEWINKDAEQSFIRHRFAWYKYNQSLKKKEEKKEEKKEGCGSTEPGSPKPSISPTAKSPIKITTATAAAITPSRYQPAYEAKATDDMYDDVAGSGSSKLGSLEPSLSPTPNPRFQLPQLLLSLLPSTQRE